MRSKATSTGKEVPLARPFQRAGWHTVESRRSAIRAVTGTVDPTPENLWLHPTLVGPEAARPALVAAAHSVASARGVREVESPFERWARQEIATLRDDVARLRAELRESMEPPVLDPAARWVKDHQKTMEQYRGERVAIHGGRGVVAHDIDFAKVFDQVAAMGLLGEVVFDFVPAD